jgi:hypothetical protein
VLDSARLSRTFFGLGPFRAAGLTVGPGPAFTLTETATAAYYQPLAPSARSGDGRYRLGDEGRFSAAMDFDRRTRDEVTLTTTVRVEPVDDGVQLTVDIAGAAVDWALELAFRPGGTMTGARALGGGRWQLERPACSYRVGDDVLGVAVLSASDGAGGPLAPSESCPGYQPGEDYEFLGGTDAADGELLYLTGRSPAQLRLGVFKKYATLPESNQG